MRCAALQVVYAAYLSAQAAYDVVVHRGSLLPAAKRLRDGVSMVSQSASRRRYRLAPRSMASFKRLI